MDVQNRGPIDWQHISTLNHSPFAHFLNFIAMQKHKGGARKTVLSQRAFSQKVLWLIEEVCLPKFDLVTLSQSGTDKTLHCLYVRIINPLKNGELQWRPRDGALKALYFS